MTGWLRRLTAFCLVCLLASCQTLTPSVSLAQPCGDIEGNLQLSSILEGQPVEGEITSSDSRVCRVHVDGLLFAGYANDRITVTLRPSGLAGLMLLNHVGGDILGSLEFEPDGAVRSLQVKLPSDGTYRILIGSARFGSYSVTLSSTGNSGDVDPRAGRPDVTIVPLQFGQWHEGELEESDRLSSGDAEDFAVDAYMVRGLPGQRFRVTVESDAFNPALILTDMESTERRQRAGRNGRIVMRDNISSRGSFMLMVMSSDGGMGRYRIIVEPHGER